MEYCKLKMGFFAMAFWHIYGPAAYFTHTRKIATIENAI
jgi:hypothetical protein